VDSGGCFLISAMRKTILSQKKGLTAWGGSIEQRGGWARGGKGDDLLGWQLMSYGFNSLCGQRGEFFN